MREESFPSNNRLAHKCVKGCESGREGADVGEDLGWEFADGCECVSDRSDGTGSFNQAFFGADDLIEQVNQTLAREETTEGS